MAEEPTPADPSLVIDLIEGFRRSKTMFAAVELGVFDTLAEGPRPAAELGEMLRCNPAALTRLLDACVGLKLLERLDGRYANTAAAAEFLCTASPNRLTGYIRYSNAAAWKLWAHLEDAVREGTHCWQQAFGWDGPIFSHFFRDDEAKREFLMGMHGFGILSSPKVVAAVDLSPFRHLVDLGGATGHLAIAACKRYPQLRATVLDLPAVTPLTQEIVAASGVADRIEVVSGDFFTDPLPSADLYALGRILHDWSDEKVLRLLTQIFEALPEGGGLLIAEKLLHDDYTGPVSAQMQDLNMLTCTEGRERSLAGYVELCARVGFGETQGARTGAAVDAVLARKR